MANNKKKTKRRLNRRLKRTVMGTLSAVLMVSAVIVALIPVPESKAAATDLESSLLAEATLKTSDYIPDYIGGNYPVYASADGNFRVAYGSNGGKLTGVVVYYDTNNVVSNASLTIPSEIIAFLYHKDKTDYVAVNSSNEYLYYVSQEKADATYNEDGSINTPAMNMVLSPCLGSKQENWSGQSLYVVAGADGAADVEIVSNNSISYKVSEPLVIPVQYVGSTRYEVEINDAGTGPSSDGKYYAQGAGPGVFEGATNFSTLVIPEKILGIGDNAFKGCQMQNVKVENGVRCVGNNAFRDCNQMSTIGFVEPSNLVEIGDYAFAGCTYLTSVKIPDEVQKLGNCVFKDCTNLSAVNIYGKDGKGNTSLTTVGSGLFYNCLSLTQMAFPIRVANIDKVQYTLYGCASLTYLGLPENAGTGDNVFKYNNVTGCSSLDTVKVPARNLKLDCADSGYVGAGTYDNIYTGAKLDIFSATNLGEGSAFQDTYEVSDEFCILANSQSYAHTYTQKHGEAFGYLDSGYEGWYEKIVDGYAFRVDETNTLVNFEKIDKNNDGSNVIIPDNIAKYHVASISSGTFSGNEEIEYLYIPASVAVIDAGAFRGCTSLRTVNFDNALGIQSIGTDAFKTGVVMDDIDTNKDNIPDESLCFIGDISSDCIPFNYAMDVNNNYNDPAAPTQYIKYTSGFPQNLQIQMVVTKNENTNQIESAYPVVVAIPTEEQLKGTKSYSLSTYDGNSEYVRTKDQENTIVASAYNKYQNNLTNPSNPQILTEEEQEVIDAVYHVVIEDGIKGLKDDLFTGNTAVESVILETIESVPDNEFKGCTSLDTFIMNSSGNASGESLGERAFQDCTALENVTMPSTLSEIVSMPFAGCTKLTNVGFSGSPYFTCEEAIIKGAGEDGNFTRVVECLESRGNLIGAAKLSASEFAGVTTIDPCAFQYCTGIKEAYLDEAEAAVIPDCCFDGAIQLYYCSLPDSAKKIGKYAFRNTALSTISIPDGVQSIDDTAFITEDAMGNQNYIQGLTVECAEDSTAYWYCQDKDGITAQTYVQTFTVTFLDWDDYVLKTETVKKGASATAPRTSREGYALVGWTEDFDKVKEDIVTKAIYEKSNAATIEGFYSVVFQDFDGLYTWDTQYLKEGATPTTPNVTPTRKGYIFSYWAPSNYTSIQVTGNLIVKAYYTEDPNYVEGEGSGSGTTDTTKRYKVEFVDHDGTVLDTQMVTAGSCPTATTVVPTRSGYTFTTWSPSNYATVPVTTDIQIKALYSKNSSGGDSEDDEVGGQTSSDSSNESSSGGGSSNGTGNGTGNSNNNQTQTGNGTTAGSGGGSTVRPSGTISGNSSTTIIHKVPTGDNTKVVITKTGISNKDLVSAKISGSKDNFVVKISDSTEARAAVEAALLKEYGSLDNLKYFAMDISLYDSTGTSKIENTAGLTVTVTLPLPDALAGYAGNNKAGAVKNGAFEKLNSRLTSIDNVACITFDTTHFSPYAIYVETDNLTSGVVDVTPTTGDPIHPKWFLSIGLALLSVIMFFGKGSKNKIVKVIE
nr:leucine-rich repeat protein [Lachnospiraceae bacterium]